MKYAEDLDLLATEETVLQGMNKTQTGIGRDCYIARNVEKTKVMGTQVNHPHSILR
jgi:hypothetical protein